MRRSQTLQGFLLVSPGNVVFNRIPLRFKGKPCNKLRYLPAWKAIASIGKGPFEWLTSRTGRPELFDQFARLRRIVVGRCYISHETATGKWKCLVILRKIDERANRPPESPYFRRRICATIFDGFHGPRGFRR